MKILYIRKKNNDIPNGSLSLATKMIGQPATMGLQDPSHHDKTSQE